MEYTQVFKALAHPKRLEILSILSLTSLNVTDLCRQLNKHQSNVSQHLQVLRENNLVVSKKIGKKRIYELNRQNIRLVRYLCKFKI